jgi:hypothetical protein
MEAKRARNVTKTTLWNPACQFCNTAWSVLQVLQYSHPQRLWNMARPVLQHGLDRFRNTIRPGRFYSFFNSSQEKNTKLNRCPNELKFCTHLYEEGISAKFELQRSKGTRSKRRLSKIGFSPIPNKVDFLVLMGKLVEPVARWVLRGVMAPEDQPKTVPKTSYQIAPKKDPKNEQKRRK